jgi:hypothetical protein
MTNVVRRLLGLLVIAAVALGVGIAGSTADAQPTVNAPTARAATTTTVTLKVPTCEGCRIQLFRAVRGVPTIWQSRVKVVRDGMVSFTMANRNTHGMSMTVTAPWEGNTGYVTQAAFRYNGQSVGSTVGFALARTKTRAAGCWAGTKRSAITLRLGVRKVTVPGNTGPTAGTIAWFPRTQAWWRPMQDARKGVLGAQDVFFCQRP